jgi:hypothetical protein
VSSTYRSHRRPGTGTASTKWNPPTGATMSSIYRRSTISDGQETDKTGYRGSARSRCGPRKWL